MIISKTPFRVSFLGGGTDLEAFSKNYGGAVLGSTIDKYIYHTVSTFPSKFFDYSLRFSYSKIECANDINSIQHKPFREILRHFKCYKDLEVNIIADLPSFTGLGTSSAFTVGLIKALSKLKNLNLSKTELASKAIMIEQKILKEAVGCQDQIFASFGGFNMINIQKNGDFKVIPIKLSKNRQEELENSLVLFFTGIKRKAQDIEKQKIENINNINNNLKKMLGIVETGYNILNNNTSLIKFGELLHENWIEKKLLNDMVSSTFIDEAYQKAIDTGAVGGKLLGAGGGGFLLLFVPPDKRKLVRKELSFLSEVKFNFSMTGSEIIYE